MGEKIRSDGPQTHLVKKGTPTMGGLVFLLTISGVTLLFNYSRTQALFPTFVAAISGLFGALEDFTKVYKKSNLSQLFENSKIATIKKLLANSKLINLLCAPWSLFKKLANIVGSSSEKGLTTAHKFILEFGIAGFVSYWTYVKLGWDYIWLPLIGNVNIGFFYPIFLVLFFLTFLNFVNFTDGIDGLVGGLSIIAFIAFWALSSTLSYNSIAVFCATVVGALIPFLYFNVNPARIFMGDVGSHALAAALVTISIVMHREIALIVVGGVFLIDGITSPLQQLVYKATKKRLFRMAPIHHAFEVAGWPETKVTIRFWLMGAALAVIGLFIGLL
ncbi:MAG: phospho-N-acetylmuramoyl-pentapeptide-transferase [Patescibacteria group bacterium]